MLQKTTTLIREAIVAQKGLRLNRLPTGAELNTFYGSRSPTARITRFGGIKKLSQILRAECDNDVIERGSYQKLSKIIEIESEFSTNVYKLGDGLISFENSTFELDQLNLLIKELQGIYDVYVDGVHYMKYRKIENT